MCVWCLGCVVQGQDAAPRTSRRPCTKAQSESAKVTVRRTRRNKQPRRDKRERRAASAVVVASVGRRDVARGLDRYDDTAAAAAAAVFVADRVCQTLPIEIYRYTTQPPPGHPQALPHFQQKTHGWMYTSTASTARTSVSAMDVGLLAMNAPSAYIMGPSMSGVKYDGAAVVARTHSRILRL